jgi:hypothetical protein
MLNNQILLELNLNNNNLSKGERFFNIKYYLSKTWSLKKLYLEECYITP